jgi:hypothetical protein
VYAKKPSGNTIKGCGGVAIYDRLSGTASRLLDRYGQGTVEIGTPVTVPGANPWDAPTTTTQWDEVNALVRGVSAQYVDNVNIVATDKQVLFQGEVDAGDKVRIDGQVCAVLRVDYIPGAGEAVATRVFVRG